MDLQCKQTKKTKEILTFNGNEIWPSPISLYLDDFGIGFLSLSISVCVCVGAIDKKLKPFLLSDMGT